jgi:hypothetical protein
LRRDEAKKLGVAVPPRLLPESGPPGPWVVELIGWIPPSTNSLVGVHWTKRRSIKRVAAARVAAACKAAGVVRAAGRRRVEVVVTVDNASHKPDPDNLPKALFDGLRDCGAIVDDSAEWLDAAMPLVAVGKAAGTVVTISDGGAV